MYEMIRSASAAAARLQCEAFVLPCGRPRVDPLVTISPFSRACLVRDLKLPASKITEVRLLFDAERAERVAALRFMRMQEEIILYVAELPSTRTFAAGAAFARTVFARRDGQARAGGVRTEVRSRRVPSARR